MNSPLHKKKQIDQFLNIIKSYVQINDKEFILALACAILAHGRKTDKEGEPYILHPIRVATKLNNREAKIVAILHDVVEDSSFTLTDLHEIGFSSSTIYAVEALTRKKGQIYSKYLIQVASNPLAKEVKLADIEDNMNPERLSHLDYITRKRLLKKYTSAINYLSR